MSYACPNDWKKVRIVDQFDMALRADLATERSFAEARRRLGSSNPTEPELVLSFFIHALQEIEDEWNSVLSTYPLHLKISGVFAHQTPKVLPLGSAAASDARKRGFIPKLGKRFCELGDLLFIVSHQGSKKGTGNAMMLQAKKGFQSSSDPLQRTLYEHSPKFEYRLSTPALNGQKRILTPKSDTKLAYWDLNAQINPPYPHRSTTVIYAADARLDDYTGASFGDTLTQMVFGKAGTGFSLPAQGTAWSGIVGDLVKVTAAKVMKQTPVNSRGAPRGHATNRLALSLASSGGSVLVRNSLAEALLSLSDDHAGAAAKLDDIQSLKDLLIKQRGAPPEPPKLLTENENDNEGGVTTVFVRCGVD